MTREYKFREIFLRGMNIQHGYLGVSLGWSLESEAGQIGEFGELWWSENGHGDFYTVDVENMSDDFVRALFAAYAEKVIAAEKARQLRARKDDQGNEIS